MMGKSHLIISTGVTLSVMSLLGHEITIPAVAVAGLSALLPDIDEPNSLLVRKAVPESLLRILQVSLIGAAIYLYFAGIAAPPWNIALALLIGSVSFLPGRRLRHLVMLLLALALFAFADAYDPWNYIAACVLVVSSVVPHRGLTHTLYAVAGWGALLYFASLGMNDGGSLWIAGGMSYALHLLADSLTQRGITPLPPLPFKLRLKLMSTGTKKGSAVEKFCIVLTLVLVMYVFVLTPNL
ncbi:metal-dependent hydrolase [Paenibacillus riograndensis]|uniref:Membrane-bound metal-dependent hydrolase n=1 Tax=Paenibacillus riograndensis SBR5 TaxID=1073571 RepID=A0A0E4H808_9BACL|nr:metal-dependent hydrolase [Paenibacillus riograndensis]CQR53721.1 membrane-bound metal-dependent hydrolase [Paenibacillus riograndensis SBR5]